MDFIISFTLVAGYRIEVCKVLKIFSDIWLGIPAATGCLPARYGPGSAEWAIGAPGCRACWAAALACVGRHLAWL